MTVLNKKLATKAAEVEGAYTRVQHFFFSFPSHAFSLSELVQVLRISKTSANSAVTRLEKEGFLRIEVLGRLWRISTNPMHTFHLKRKVPYNLHHIYDSNIVEAVKQNYPGAKSIVLFGSYRKGDDTEKSDIDIAVEVIGNQPFKIIHLGTFKQLGYRERVPVNLHIFSRNNINMNLFANIANGIVLDGFLEVRA